MQERKSTSYILLVWLWIVWAYSWPVNKIAMGYMGPMAWSFWRMVCASSVLGLLVLLTRRSFKMPSWRFVFWLGITQTTAFTLLTNLALVVGGSGKVSVLAYTMPFWTLILARIFLHERPSRIEWWAIGLSFAGLISILEPWHLDSTWQADLFAVGGGLAWAAAIVIAKHYRQTIEVDTLALTFWQMVVGAIPLGIIVWLMPAESYSVSRLASPEFILSLLYAGVLSGGLGWLLWMHLLTKLSASAAGLNILAIPVLSVSIAWLQFGEVPSTFERIGMGLIGLALLILSIIPLIRQQIIRYFSRSSIKP